MRFPWDCLKYFLSKLFLLSLFSFSLSIRAAEASTNRKVDSAGVIRVAVAANFYSPLKRLIERYPKKDSLQLHLASSGLLYAQIVQGAPIDIFLSADTHYTRALIEQGKAAKESEALYACGILALWSKKEKLSSQKEKLELKKNNLRSRLLQVPKPKNSHKTLAIANPKTAPYGFAALSVINEDPFLSQQRRIHAPNVAASFQYVHAGAADWGFVALSQLIDQAVPQEHIWEVPQHQYPPIQQALVITERGILQPGVAEFRSYLLSDSVQEQLPKLGYRPFSACT